MNIAKIPIFNIGFDLPDHIEQFYILRCLSFVSKWDNLIG
jgi:hypothetical protein